MYSVAGEIRKRPPETGIRFRVLKGASCRKIIGTQIFIALRTEQVDEDGSLVGSWFWFSWETCW